ncbi:MAG: Wzz/FepE/Etk N-terminal domain-containing protein [Aliarcobacter sp.]|jgi:LPS O-antigen subunit length determinant protein (WzzB/FepE family)|nr:Wzz/FepE/Etk N-terminal domain-containing protein [Aliarcobacter sp.]
MEQNEILIEDEIDLKKLFSVIWQKKIFVICFTLLITIVSTIYVYTKTPIYEVKSIMEIGFLENKVVDDPAVVEQKLNIIFGVEDKNTNNNAEKGIITSIKKDKDVKNFIEIKTEAISNDIALAKNKEVLELTKELYNNKIEQFKTFLNNDIVNIQREIDYVNNVEIKNILSQISILKEQEIFKINREIENLKNQNLKIANNEIDFLKNEKLKKLSEKISFYKNNLEKFDKEINELNKTISINQDKTALLVISTQLINYQNLMLNTQNQINELELQVQQIIKEIIPKLEINKENIFLVQIKDLEMKKQNVSNDTIKKLEDKINIELKTKISQLEEKKNTTKFKFSEENISNAKLVGNYVISDYPVKPKKMLIIIISFITAFVLSIFIAFFINFIRDNKITKTPN